MGPGETCFYQLPHSSSGADLHALEKVWMGREKPPSHKPSALFSLWQRLVAKDKLAEKEELTEVNLLKFPLKYSRKRGLSDTTVKSTESTDFSDCESDGLSDDEESDLEEEVRVIAHTILLPPPPQRKRTLQIVELGEDGEELLENTCVEAPYILDEEDAFSEFMSAESCTAIIQQTTPKAVTELDTSLITHMNSCLYQLKQEQLVLMQKMHAAYQLQIQAIKAENALQALKLQALEERTARIEKFTESFERTQYAMKYLKKNYPPLFTYAKKVQQELFAWYIVNVVSREGKFNIGTLSLKRKKQATIQLGSQFLSLLDGVPFGGVISGAGKLVCDTTVANMDVKESARIMDTMGSVGQGLSICLNFAAEYTMHKLVPMLEAAREGGRYSNEEDLMLCDEEAPLMQSSRKSKYVQLLIKHPKKMAGKDAQKVKNVIDSHPKGVPVNPETLSIFLIRHHASKDPHLSLRDKRPEIKFLSDMIKYSPGTELM